MKNRLLTGLLVVIMMLCLAVVLRAADITSIMANATRASTIYSSDVSISKYQGTGQFYLTAGAQGSGATSTLKLQQSSEPTVGYNQDDAGDTDSKLMAATGTDTYLSAQFVQSGNRQVKSVWLRLKQVGTITGSLYCAVQGDTVAGGLPDNVAQGTSAAVDASGISDDYEWTEFTFATPVDLTSTDTYHLVLSGTYSQSNTNYIAWSANTVTSGGNAEANNSSWANVATLDFEAFVMQYQFSDVTGGAFTVVGNAASLQTLTLNLDSLKDYVRVKDTVTSTATGPAAIILIGKYKYSE